MYFPVEIYANESGRLSFFEICEIGTEFYSFSNIIFCWWALLIAGSLQWYFVVTVRDMSFHKIDKSSWKPIPRSVFQIWSWIKTKVEMKYVAVWDKLIRNWNVFWVDDLDNWECKMIIKLNFSMKYLKELWIFARGQGKRQ